MRFTLVVIGLAVLFIASSAQVRADEALDSDESSIEVVSDDDGDLGDIIEIDGVQFDISQMSAEELEEFLSQLEQLEAADPDAELDVDDDEELSDSEERR